MITCLDDKHMQICFEDYIKYLGVLIDNNLNWKQYIKQMSNKISKGIGILAKMRNFLPLAVLRNLYNAFIASHINHAITASGNLLLDI